MNPKVVKLLKAALIDSPLSEYFFPRYRFFHSPVQLCFLCECLAATKDVEGAICEVGCATGWTTVFLNKYMDSANIDKAYYAIDTFAGFVSEDVEFEVCNRGKRQELFSGFTTNNKSWFDKTMLHNNIRRVHSIETDINRFDLTTVGPVSFALLDVDLYRPMRKAMPELYDVLSPGGIVIVDDCEPFHVSWDGSDQAYKEMMKAIGHDPEIVHGKYGIIRKPRSIMKSLA
jgi:O-methyltransferase